MRKEGRADPRADPQVRQLPGVLLLLLMLLLLSRGQSPGGDQIPGVGDVKFRVLLLLLVLLLMLLLLLLLLRGAEDKVLGVGDRCGRLVAL